MYQYPDIDYARNSRHHATARNTLSSQQWRRGYMADAKLASWPWRMASGAIDYVPLVVIFDFLRHGSCCRLRRS